MVDPSPEINPKLLAYNLELVAVKVAGIST
jgi:hypothetical protein